MYHNHLETFNFLMKYKHKISMLPTTFSISVSYDMTFFIGYNMIYKRLTDFL